MFWIDSMVMTPDIGYLKEFVVDSMDKGVKIADLKELRTKLTNQQSSVQRRLWEVYHLDNPNSPKQVLGVLDRFTDPRVRDCCYDEDTDKWTTNAEALTALKDCGFEFAELMLDYRDCTKRLEVINNLSAASDSYGFVHPTVTLAKSNRINYSKPALLGIHKDMLYDIVRPRDPRNVLFSCDIKNQEPWVLVNMLSIKVLKDLIANLDDGESLYKAIFRDIFKRDYTNEAEYDETKTAWNALTYGISKKMLLKQCRVIDGAAIYKYFMGIKELKDFNENCRKLAYTNTQEVRTYFGTKVYADEMGSRLHRVLMDIQIQGTGTDILALLIQHCIEELEERGLDEVITVYFTRHDEIIFEVDRDYYEQAGIENVTNLLRNITEHKVDDWEPFRVDIEEVYKK